MLDSIILFSIRNKVFVGLMTLLLIIWGVWSATRLPIDAVPDITNNQVQIYTSCPTLAGQEVEQLVTFPIEQSIANVAGVEEIRSISRFGLSVITVVFEEKVDIYFARQQINERLKEAEERIPVGIGTPELAPVSTGLGEVYQYIIHPKNGSEYKYSASDLRTMQDWIVARQLNGTPGIAEINSFGGELKQYEVSVNPARLKAMGVSIPEIVTALELNNQNTGGAYIDKKPQAYFIRGIGLATSLEDVRAIAVKKTGAVPVLIRDVAEVGFGSAVRYGALTYNGEVDAVGGVVMMLKGENSHEVVKRIKEKLPTIQRSLPDDIVIEPYLDRTDLVGRAVHTVEKNLIEGALIVVFVLVLFLGNFRAGLIVASAIPLSMMFALGMMNVFDVSANLMSLGAIDFGLIVDGAVIIVESTLHHLAVRTGTQRLTQQEMDQEVYRSASRIRTSAAFGEIIILIVYIPILSLAGIEGKMFAPMAMTVGFAILGALILSMTYIPMMCALFLPKQRSSRSSLSEKWVSRLQGFYQPLLQKAIKYNYLIIATGIGLMVLSVFLVRRMGGEFIPQLQEGDYAFHCFLPAGSSLSQSIETSMQASRILKSFDEVQMVVGKTGSAEVPTDPMPPEATDLMVILKPEDEWPEGKTSQSLANEMMEKLSVIPGVYFEKNQPIQMRFNELMTGIRQDVAIKIFGENMDTLASCAEQVASVVRSIKGATEPQVERVSGLPQINVEYDRARLANYGLTVNEVNDVLSAAFAGKKAGVIFENERRFDVVVRLDSAERRSIEDVSNLMIPTSDGLQIPLYQVARVDFRVGPAQISREGGKRRIVIGFNVSGRDIESVVEDIRAALVERVKLPSGYYFDYGGQFENLKKATDRLSLAVPLSLLLIYLLLYLTFQSFKQASLVFTSIPMAAIGGVFALLLRGMPFSISAGIGFIALFGVSVLNAIVLIGTFNQLEKEGVESPLERVIKGTLMRLRPVLMTAAVASLGFLPMAMSTSAGAEVQKPLATVVIGGLLSATFMTLFILPLLYLLLSGKRKTNPPGGSIPVLFALLLVIGLPGVQAQQRLTVEEAVDIALKSNQQFLINEAGIKSAGHQVKAAGGIPKTGLFAENEDLHPSDHVGILKVGLSQSVAWPGLYATRKKYYREILNQYELNTRVIGSLVKRDVEQVYYQLWYLQDKQRLTGRLDSIYTNLLEAAAVRLRAGESTRLEWMAAEMKQKEIRVLQEKDSLDMVVQQRQLMVLLNREDWFLPELQPIGKFPVVSVAEEGSHPLLDLQHQKVQVVAAEVDVERKTNLPELSGRFFTQRLWGATDPFTGFSVMAAIPVFSQGAHRSRVKAVEARKEQAEHEVAFQQQVFDAGRENSLIQLRKADQMIRFYESSGLAQAEEIIQSASIGYRSGELSFADMMQFLSQAITIRQNYLDAMNTYNQAAIQLNYYNNR